MKAIVLKSFKDKETGKEYRHEQEFKGSKERIEQINSVLKNALKPIEEIEVIAEVVEPKRKRRSKKA
jgi:hypothetical protein